MVFTSDQVRALAGGVFIMLVQGSLYVYGAIAPYIVSHLYYQGNDKITLSKLSIILTLSIIMQNTGLFLANIKILKFSFKIMCLISIVGISASMFILSFVDLFISYILIYGVAFGLFIGYGYLASIKNCYDYLPDRKGLCSGVCLMGFGLGAVLFNLILTQLINPDNLQASHQVDDQKYYPESVANNVQFGLRIISGIYLVIGLVGVILVKPKESKTNPLIEIQNQIQRDEAEPSKEGSLKTHSDYSAGIMELYKKQVSLEDDERLLSKRLLKFLRQKKQHLLVLILSMSAPFGVFVAFNYKSYAYHTITDDKQLSFIGMMGGLSNGLSRFMWGYLFDRFSFRAISSIINLLLLFCCGAIYWSIQNYYGYLATVVVSYACYGGNYSIYPTQTIRMMGKTIGSRIYYITFMGFSIGCSIQYLLHYFLIDQLGKEGYKYCFMIFGAMLSLALILSLTLKFQYDEKQLNLHQSTANRSITNVEKGGKYDDILYTK